MKIILPSILLFLSAFYNPGECLKCHMCVTPAPSQVSLPGGDQEGLLGGFSKLLEGAVSGIIKTCQLKGDHFDPDSFSGDTNKEEQKCMKAVAEVDGATYTIRGVTGRSCQEAAREIMLLAYKKPISDDKITFCQSCESNLCNSGNSFNSLQITFFTSAMLIVLYFIF